jgi:hypothetical protein
LRALEVVEEVLIFGVFINVIEVDSLKLGNIVSFLFL